jgi:hypothetical protein
MLSDRFAMKSHNNFSETNLGCEFIDDGYYGNISIVSSNVLKPIYLPMFIISKTLDRKYIAEIKTKDKQYIDELAYSIKMNGIFEPGKLTFDDTNVRLSDGNHRFLASEIVGLKLFPVHVAKVDKLKSGSVRFVDLFPDILEFLWQEK